VTYIDNGTRTIAVSAIPHTLKSDTAEGLAECAPSDGGTVQHTNGTYTGSILMKGSSPLSLT